MLEPWDAVIIEYCIPSNLTWKFTASLQSKISVAITHFINRNIIYILKDEYSINNELTIYFNFITVNLTNTSFTISIMTEYTAAFICSFASIGIVYKLLSQALFTYYDCPWLYPTNYIGNMIKPPA